MKKATLLLVLALLSCKKQATVTTSTLTGIIDVVSAGVDNTGGSDVSLKIQQLIDGLDPNTPATLFFGSGRYKIDAGILIAATVTSKSGVSLVGAGRDGVYFESACVRGFGIWYNNTTNSGDNFQGMQLRNFTIRDTSGNCSDVIKFTQTAENVIENVKIMNAKGKYYSVGTVSATGQILTGQGTQWTKDLEHGVLQVDGKSVEICSVESASSATLCSTTFPGGLSTPKAYMISYGGRALGLDPGFSYTQYISVRDLMVWNSLYGIFSYGSNKGGNSRISIEGKAGWIGVSGVRLANSVGIWLGKHSDTFQVSIPVNNVATCFVLESAHANSFVSADCENNSNATVVSTCNYGTASKSCLVGYQLSADGSGTGYGNAITNPYVYNTDRVFVTLDSVSSSELTITGLRGANFANNHNYAFFGLPIGCPPEGRLLTTKIINWDCVVLK